MVNYKVLLRRMIKLGIQASLYFLVLFVLGCGNPEPKQSPNLNQISGRDSIAPHKETKNLKVKEHKVNLEKWIIDINLDGFKDSLVLNNEGATGNVWYDTWLYVPAANRFKFSKAYSEISALDLAEGRENQLRSYDGQGACNETVTYYIPNGLKAPIAIEQVFLEPQRAGDSDFCWKITMKKIERKWVETSRTKHHGWLYETEYEK